MAHFSINLLSCMYVKWLEIKDRHIFLNFFSPTVFEAILGALNESFSSH